MNAMDPKDWEGETGFLGGQVRPLTPAKRRELVDWQHRSLSEDGSVRQPHRPLLPCHGDTPGGLVPDEGVGPPVLGTPTLRFQAGSRQMSASLERHDMPLSRKWVQRLMRNTRLRAIYQHPRTHQPATERRSYPDLLRYLAITRANRAWAADIIYWHMARGLAELDVMVWKGSAYN